MERSSIPNLKASLELATIQCDMALECNTQLTLRDMGELPTLLAAMRATEAKADEKSEAAELVRDMRAHKIDFSTGIPGWVVVPTPGKIKVFSPTTGEDAGLRDLRRARHTLKSIVLRDEIRARMGLNSPAEAALDLAAEISEA